jgi:predicted transcriptional regulator
MPRPASKHPTELELAILKILWRHGPLPVRDVRDALAPDRDLAYTSVMTVMNIMVEKAYLRRRKQGARYIYRPVVGEEATSRRMLGDLVDRVFDGSASAAMVNLLDTAELDPDELREIRALLDRKAEETS